MNYSDPRAAEVPSTSRIATMPKRNIAKRSRSPDDDRNLSRDIKSKPNVKVEDVNEENKQCDVSQQYQTGQQSQITQQQIPPLPQQPHMQPPYPTYAYGAHDQFNVDPNQRPYPMIAPAPYNMYAAMNAWPGNQMDGMAMQLNGMPTNQGLPVSMPQDMQPNAASGGIPYAPYMPMHGDMYGIMNGMGNYCQFSMFPTEPVAPPVKETIVLTTCSLYPPHPGQTIRTRERHPGCKTVFCGGLPEKINEDIVKEVFEKCGEISVIRMSKKNFCHVRFKAECYVDEAMKLSGYRMKIENKDESAYCGRLHVDFAKAKDDEFEYQCSQRALQREARRREREEEEAARPPTPPPVVDYSEHEYRQVFDKLKSYDFTTVMEAMHVLYTWLSRSECHKENSVFFFQLLMTMGQTCRRLLNEKNFTKKLNDAKAQMHQKMTFISLCFDDIYKVFEIVQKSPNILENFTKSQKKEIETLAKKTLEVTRSHSKEMVDERVEDEMELSDDEETAEQPVAKPVEIKKRITKEDLKKLKLENERLRAQYEVELAKNKKVKNDRDAYNESFKKSVDVIKNNAEVLTHEISELKIYKQNHLAKLEAGKSINQAHMIEGNLQGNNLGASQHEILLMTLVSNFLNAHPLGAGIDYICSYLLNVDRNINRTDVENLLRKYPNLFKEQSSGIGATLMKNWKYVGFMRDE